MKGKVINALPRPTKCNNCNSTNIRLTENSVLYGTQQGDWPIIWYCDDCQASVGCHPDTDIPLGYLADRDTKRSRMLAHEAFDPFWKSGNNGRQDTYSWLASQMGIPPKECHISHFNKEQCQQVVDICEDRRRRKHDGRKRNTRINRRGNGSGSGS